MSFIGIEEAPKVPYFEENTNYILKSIRLILILKTYHKVLTDTITTIDASYYHRNTIIEFLK